MGEGGLPWCAVGCLARKGHKTKVWPRARPVAFSSRNCDPRGEAVKTFSLYTLLEILVLPKLMNSLSTISYRL